MSIVLEAQGGHTCDELEGFGHALFTVRHLEMLWRYCPTGITDSRVTIDVDVELVCGEANPERSESKLQSTESLHH